MFGFAEIRSDGKSILFNTLMANLMGRENVGEVASTELGKDFNSWASGKALRVAEEARAVGENRHVTLNKIKTHITNKEIRVVAKGKDGVDLPNTTNYVALTNYEDALPLDDNDRRWMVIFTPWRSIDDLAAKVGPVGAYFDRLAAAINGHVGEVRKYFEECAIRDDFKYDMRAPHTDDKDRMIKAEQRNVGGGYLDVYLEGGYVGISSEIIATTLLSDLFRRDIPKDAPRTKQLSDLLKAKGFYKVDKPVKWNRFPYDIYVSDERIVNMGQEMRSQKCRELLDATMNVWQDDHPGEIWTRAEQARTVSAGF